MIRPISLFLLIGIFAGNRESNATLQPSLFWLFLLLIIIPLVSLVLVQSLKKLKAMLLFATVAMLVSWLVAVYYFSWSTSVQTFTQDLSFLGDLFVVLPPIFWLLILWFVTSPIPNRISWVSHRLRLDILLLLIPVFILLTVNNVVVLYGVSTDNVEIIELVAFLLLLAIAPFFITRILSAKPMKNYELSSSISEIGQNAGIRQSKILVWNTHNRIMNALAIGIIFQPKTIVLTDKLIENLTPQELRAVSAHEFGHHKYWHIPFLIITAVSVLIWSNKVFIYMWLDIGGGFVFILQLMLMVLGIIIVSRIFEKQADAYSAVAISKIAGSECVTESGAISLATALGAIAQTQNIRLDRNDPLHGSISSRQQNLESLVGCDFSAIPINKKVFWIKIVICASFVLGILV